MKKVTGNRAFRGYCEYKGLIKINSSDKMVGIRGISFKPRWTGNWNGIEYTRFGLYTSINFTQEEIEEFELKFN